MFKPFKRDPQWAGAKQVCRLNLEEIQMAKELGLPPKTLMKNNPGPSQQWKLPVKLWIRALHEKRFGARALTVNRPTQPASPARPARPNDDDDDDDDDADVDIPF